MAASLKAYLYQTRWSDEVGQSSLPAFRALALAAPYHRCSPAQYMLARLLPHLRTLALYASTLAPCLSPRAHFRRRAALPPLPAMPRLSPRSLYFSRLPRCTPAWRCRTRRAGIYDMTISRYHRHVNSAWRSRMAYACARCRARARTALFCLV